VEHAVSNLLGKIEHPALMNLRIVSSPVDLIQTYPIDMPDLFFGEELVLFGRYHGRGSGEVVIEGHSAGVPVRFTATAEFPATAHDNDFIPQLWASRRIGQLTRTIRLEGPSEQLIEEIRDLGLTYGILTEYTSYLVLEPGMQTGEPVPVDEIMRRNEAAGVFAPAALQTGRAGFDDAKASADMAAVGSVAEAEEAVRERTMALAKRADKDAGRRQSIPPKIEDGRLFVERDGVWTDATHRHTAEVLEVVAFSDAYFALVRAIPELTPYLTVGDDIVVAGKDISIRIGADGETTLSPGKISDTARRFRGL
jgi:Ca-activated chloride channel family protein